MIISNFSSSFNNAVTTLGLYLGCYFCFLHALKPSNHAGLSGCAHVGFLRYPFFDFHDIDKNRFCNFFRKSIFRSNSHGH